MAIPDYESLMLPLLICCEDGKEHSVREVVEALAQRLNLTDEEQRRRLPSGQQTLFYDRLQLGPHLCETCRIA